MCLGAGLGGGEWVCAQLLCALPQEWLCGSLESDLSSNYAASHCVAGWPGTNHLKSLTLSFHISKLGVIISLPLSQPMCA